VADKRAVKVAAVAVEVPMRNHRSDKRRRPFVAWLNSVSDHVELLETVADAESDNSTVDSGARVSRPAADTFVEPAVTVAVGALVAYVE
jgi:hypothetical protein